LLIITPFVVSITNYYTIGDDMPAPMRQIFAVTFALMGDLLIAGYAFANGKLDNAPHETVNATASTQDARINAVHNAKDAKRKMQWCEICKTEVANKGSHVRWKHPKD